MRVAETRGRGRLSSIDLLPDEAEPDIVWAAEQLRERSMPAGAILIEFNKRLADRGIGPISKSAWGRHAVRKAMQFRALDEHRRLSQEVIGAIGEDGADAVTVMVAEMIKVATVQMLERHGATMGPKDIMALSRALSTAVTAQRGSADYRRQLEAEVQDRLAKAADALTEAGGSAGVPEDTLAKVTKLLTTGGY